MGMVTLAVLGMPLPDDPSELDLLTWFQIKDRMRDAHRQLTEARDEIQYLRTALADRPCKGSPSACPIHRATTQEARP